MNEDSEIIFRMRDLRAAQMCSAGARNFFKRYNLDWDKFLKQGISQSELEATGDALVGKLVHITKQKKIITNGRRK